jgi:hypothetical protein
MKLLHWLLALLCGISSLEAITEEYGNTYEEFAYVMRTSDKLQAGFVAAMIASLVFVYIRPRFQQLPYKAISENIPSYLHSLLDNRDYEQAVTVLEAHENNVSSWDSKEREALINTLSELEKSFVQQHVLIDIVWGYCYTKNPAHKFVDQILVYLRRMLFVLKNH